LSKTKAARQVRGVCCVVVCSVRLDPDVHGLSLIPSSRNCLQLTGVDAFFSAVNRVIYSRHASDAGKRSSSALRAKRSSGALRTALALQSALAHREASTTLHASLSRSVKVDSRQTLWPPDVPTNPQTLLQPLPSHRIVLIPSIKHNKKEAPSNAHLQWRPGCLLMIAMRTYMIDNAY